MTKFHSFVISLGKKHLGNMFLAIKKLWLMSKFVFVTFVKWTQKKGTCQPSSNENGKTGAQKSL